MGSSALNFLRANSGLIALAVGLVILAGAWILFEALRQQVPRPRPVRKRQDRTPVGSPLVRPSFSDPVVLSSRWLPIGTAASTTDGGCLILVDRVLPESGSAALTLRVDGDAVYLNHSVQVGERLEAAGKYGIYTLLLAGVDVMRANIAIALRNHHA